MGIENGDKAQRQEYVSHLFSVINHNVYGLFRNCHLTPETFSNLPLHASVLEVGRGTNSIFADKIKELNPNVRIISIDPSLGLSPFRDDIGVITVDNTVTYKSGMHFTLEERLAFWLAQTERLREARNAGNVIAARGEQLPFKDKSFKVVVDHFGAGYYIDNDEGFEQYIESLHRCVDDDGIIHMYPLSFLGNFGNRSDKIPLLKSILSKYDDFKDDIYLEKGSFGLILRKKK